MGYLVVYSIPYEGDTTRYCDTPEEALDYAETAQSYRPFEDLGLSVYKVEKEWSLYEFEKHLEKSS